MSISYPERCFYTDNTGTLIVPQIHDITEKELLSLERRWELSLIEASQEINKVASNILVITVGDHSLRNFLDHFIDNFNKATNWFEKLVDYGKELQYMEFIPDKDAEEDMKITEKSSSENNYISYDDEGNVKIPDIDKLSDNEKLQLLRNVQQESLKNLQLYLGYSQRYTKLNNINTKLKEELGIK